MEIARADLPADIEGEGDFDWRLSIAAVIQDGPFSVFPGVTRHIAVIAGAGMELRFAAGKPHRLAPFTPFEFKGSWRLNGRLLDGPVRDLNVMVAAKRWRSDMGFLRLDRDRPLDLQRFETVPHRFAIVISGNVSLAPDTTLSAEDCLWLEDEAGLGTLTAQSPDTTLCIVSLRRPFA